MFVAGAREGRRFVGLDTGNTLVLGQWLQIVLLRIRLERKRCRGTGGGETSLPDDVESSTPGVQQQ